MVRCPMAERGSKPRMVLRGFNFWAVLLSKHSVQVCILDGHSNYTKNTYQKKITLVIHTCNKIHAWTCIRSVDGPLTGVCCLFILLRWNFDVIVVFHDHFDLDFPSDQPWILRAWEKHQRWLLVMIPTHLWLLWVCLFPLDTIQTNMYISFKYYFWII